MLVAPQPEESRLEVIGKLPKQLRKELQAPQAELYAVAQNTFPLHAFATGSSVRWRVGGSTLRNFTSRMVSDFGVRGRLGPY
uniref:Uncharacterized protein n=1 Tax=Setaria digitata TaxID=48799 RepID=A0A915PRK5_9BILA